MKVGNLVKIIVFIPLLFFLVFLIFGKPVGINRLEGSKTIDISEVLSVNGRSIAFRKAVDAREFGFPEDHGPHTDFQTEWWYFTGNLEDRANRKYGYQLTFFRRGLNKSPGEIVESVWRTENIYFAHFAVTDVSRDIYRSHEKWSRASKKLAGTSLKPFRAWIDNWSLGQHEGGFILKAGIDDTAIDLVLEPTKDIVLHGDNGLSAKSGESGNASYYYSITRLRTSGIVNSGGLSYEVTGSSWFDHEWSTSVLGSDQEGWDWFSMQLDDNTEVMLYRMRLKNGGVDPVSSGTFVDNDGQIVRLNSSDFTLEVINKWKSDKTGTEYPVEWKIGIPVLGKTLLVKPLMSGQEFNHSFRYWEGAVTVTGNEGISGRGYMELTGY